MDKECHGLADVGTFGATYQPQGRTVISAKRVFAWKFSEDGDVVRAIARLVTRGFKQREGMNFFEGVLRRLQRPRFDCWVLLRASWVWICVASMLIQRVCSRGWMRRSSCDYPLAAAKRPVR